jgi:type IX secretion system PorP/SprF family membrane protein
MPYYTQFTSNAFMLNPAIAGTKGIVNACVNYRMQWVGFDDAPRTAGVSLHSRLANGKMGLGGFVIQDKVGPTQQTNMGASYAFHIHFPDCELSAGVAGHYTQFSLIGSKMFLHNTQDPAIDQSVTNTTGAADANMGLYLYNDRFHIGVSALHVLKAKAEFYKNDNAKKGIIQYTTQYYASVGYNYSQHPDYIFENCIFVNYLQGVPLMIDYTLRAHYKQKLITGVSIRLRDAIALHLGATIMNNLQVVYSYDILINRIRTYSSGSHEIMLKYNINRSTSDKNGPKVNKFAKQRYSIF